MSRISSLGELFAEYKVYPNECFPETSTVRKFQKTHPWDPYAQDLNKLLPLQQYNPQQRGADLPWWGEKFFSATGDFRVMVISQDSLTEDAGSVVFHACFMTSMDLPSYKRYRREHHIEHFRSWGMAKELLNQMSELKNMYITDASKVYIKGSWKDRDFDSDLSRKLLVEEIELCDPNLLVLLGASPLRLLAPKETFSQVVGREILNMFNRDCVAAPFPSVANHYHYRSRVEHTMNLLRSYTCPKHKIKKNIKGGQSFGPSPI
jgi:hypothetical protein